MRSSALSTLALAASASAIAAPGPAITPAAQLGLKPLEARQNVLDSASCAATLVSMVGGIPSPTNTALESFISTAIPLESIAAIAAKNPEIDEVDLLCTAAGQAAKVTPPASLAADYTSWSKELDGWYSTWKPVVASIAPKCGTSGPVLELLVATDEKQCKDSINKLKNGEASTAADGKKNAAAGLAPRVAAAVAVVAGIVAVAAI